MPTDELGSLWNMMKNFLLVLLSTTAMNLASGFVLATISTSNITGRI
jgi:hypothetical protein